MEPEATAEARNDEAASTWMDDLPEGEGPSVNNFDISSSANDFNLLTLMNFMDTGAIVIPHYQRNFTWDIKRASKLVESLIIGLPVPQLFFYEESRNKFAVLDGQQRLMSVYFFWKKRFPKKERRSQLRDIFSAKGFYPPEVLASDDYFSQFNLYLPASQEEGRSPFDGMNYDTLGEAKSDLDLRTIRSVIIKQNEPDPESEGHSAVYEIFDRLNTGGVNLKPQEIRSNIYFSDFYEALYELNKLAEWRELIGQEQRDINLRDVELLLRLSAMLAFSDKYKPSMIKFLNRFSAVAKRRFGADEIRLIVDILTAFIQKAAPLKESFYAGGRFSIGTAESVLHACAKDAFATRDPARIKDFSDKQVQDISASIRPFLVEGSSKSENVKSRLEAALKQLP